MFLITVIPISRGISKESLTYLSPNKVKGGSLISVPLRKKIVNAVVIESKDARSQKMKIRSSNFMLRKVDTLNERSFLPEETIFLIQKISDYYGTTIGATLYGLIHKYILDEK